MTLDPWVLAAIFGMAAATYLTRAGGYFLFRATRPPQVVRDLLSYVPGALFISYVVPSLVNGGVQSWAGAAATLATFTATGKLPLSVLCGTATAWLIWAW